MTPQEKYNEALANQLIPKMEARGFEACYCPTGKDAFDKLLTYMGPGSSIGWGGSMTMTEIGMMHYLKNEAHDYVIYDRDKATTPEERLAVFAQIVTADFFLMSANAISLDGELINIDGTGNRVAALCYGPKNVMVVVSLNKVVKGTAEAISRARNVAAPLNTARLNQNTPCTKTGSCGNCLAEDCICSHLIVTRHVDPAKRIKVILVGETLGY